MKRLWSLCGLLFVVFFTPYLLANSITVGPHFKSLHSLNVEYTLDPVTKQQALTNHNVSWQTNHGKTLNLGMNLSPLWLKLPIENTSLHDLPLILSIDNPLLDEVSVFHLQGDHVKFSTRIGDALPLENRQIKNESLLVSLTIPKASHSVVYLRVKNNGGLRVPLSLWEPSEYLKHKSKFNLLYGLLVGFILSLAITNLVLYGFSRRSYFAYTGFLLMLLWLSLAYLYGFGYRYLGIISAINNSKLVFYLLCTVCSLTTLHFWSRKDSLKPRAKLVCMECCCHHFRVMAFTCLCCNFAMLIKLTYSAICLHSDSN